MNDEAFDRLEALLSAPIEGKFNMDRWRVANFDSDHNICGYSACAIGQCVNDPWFAKQGFVLREGSKAWHFDPCYRDVVGLDAVRIFFGISYRVAQALFVPVYVAVEPDDSSDMLMNVRDITPEDVLERIRYFRKFREIAHCDEGMVR